MPADSRPLPLRVVRRFGTVSFESGLASLINHMPAAAYQHAVLTLKAVAEFRRRVRRDGVEFIALNRPSGQGHQFYPRLRRMRTTSVHTRNLGLQGMPSADNFARDSWRLRGRHGGAVGNFGGGIAELRDDGRTRVVVPATDVRTRAQALVRTSNRTEAEAQGKAGRLEVERRFSMQTMVAAYQHIYDRQLAVAGRTQPLPSPQ